MNAKDISELLFKTSDSVHSYWNFYVATWTAIAGWIISQDQPIALALKFSLTVGFLCFIFLNLAVLMRGYAFLDILSAELRASVTRESLCTNALYERIDNMSFGLQKRFARWAHLGGDVGVLAIIWTDGLQLGKVFN